MITDIIRLCAGDFDEAIDFLNLVFAEHYPHDFANMLPSVYQPTDEHMRCNYAVREGGRLGAIVGVFPIRWRVGDVTLKVAGVGGVSVHPQSRGRGYMKLLMEHAVAEMRREGYDMSYLGGRRQRYAYFGYEVAGTTCRVNFNRDNVRHTVDTDEPGLTFEPAHDDPATNAELKALHDAQLAYCERPVEAFHRYLRSWHCRPTAAKEADGRIVGYLSAHPTEPVINEFVARGAPTAAAMVRAWVADKSEKLTVVLRMPPGPVLRELQSFAESLHLFHAGNYQVFDWVKVLDALLKVECTANPLPAGTVVLGIDDAGLTVRLVVDGNGARCEATDENPHLTLDSRMAVRVLFNLGGPASVVELPRSAEVLSAWCPLPMGFSLQDHV